MCKGAPVVSDYTMTAVAVILPFGARGPCVVEELRLSVLVVFEIETDDAIQLGSCPVPILLIEEFLDWNRQHPILPRH